MSEAYEQIKHQLSPELRAVHEELIARLEAIAESRRQAFTRADWAEAMAELKADIDRRNEPIIEILRQRGIDVSKYT